MKRYTLVVGGHFDAPIQCDEGAWVRYEDHAAEVERLRAENDRLREDLAWMTAEAHAQREAAIYGAVYANAYPHVSTRVAMSHAEDAVEAWREAQKGGSDG